MNRTDEIVGIVSDIQGKYRKKFEKYTKDVTKAMNAWFTENDIPMDLRHALLCYAHQIANDLDLTFAFQLAMQDYEENNEVE